MFPIRLGFMPLGLFLISNPAWSEDRVPTMFTGGGFSKILLAEVNCSHLHANQKHSVNPIEGGMTTQAERQFLIQYKMFRCVPDSVYHADRVIHGSQGSISEFRFERAVDKIMRGGKDKAAKTQSPKGDDKFPGIPAKATKGMSREQKAAIRNARKQFKRDFKAKAKATQTAGGEKLKKPSLGANFASSFGLVKYIAQLNALMFEKKASKYNPADSAYPWAWPKNAINAVGDSLKIAFGGIHEAQGLPQEISELLSPRPKTSGFGHSPSEEELKADNVFFLEPLTAPDPNSGQPGHRQANHERCVQNYHRFLDKRDERDQCLDAQCDAMDQLQKELLTLRRDTISNLLTEIRYLRREHQETQLCLLRGETSCGRSLEDIARDELQAVVVCGDLGFPLMSSFSTNIHGSKRDADHSCRAAQRADHAHRRWARSVRMGHTVDGFNQAWVSMLAHSVIRANEAMPFQLDFRRSGFDKGGEFRDGIFALRDREVPGLTNGQCHFGPLE